MILNCDLNWRMKWTHPGDKLAQYDSVGEDVWAVVVPAATQTLRGHPPRRADRRQSVAVAENDKSKVNNQQIKFLLMFAEEMWII